MNTRDLRFGSITLSTNGVNIEDCLAAFDRENLPLQSEHPPNWAALRTAQLAQFADIPLDDLGGRQIKKVVRASSRKLSQPDIDRAHDSLSAQQAVRDALTTYDESKGFFEDLAAAVQYVETLMRVGLHSLSGLVHSDLYCTAHGESYIRSKGGVRYKVKPNMDIDGSKHTHNLSLWLGWPTDAKEVKRDRRFSDKRWPIERETRVLGELRKYLVEHQWTDGLQLSPKYIAAAVVHEGPMGSTAVYEYEPGMEESLAAKLAPKGRKGKGQEVKIWTLTYQVESPELGVHLDINCTPGDNMWASGVVHGEYRNLKRFCQILINQLDGYFSNTNQENAQTQK